MRHSSFGQYLRQLRRQLNLTQIELGIPKFSKSYVSAVERDQVIPSQNALEHFAEKLHQTTEVLASVLRPAEETPLSPPSSEEEIYVQEMLSLLDVILKGDHTIPLLLPTQLRHFALLSPLDTLWQRQRGRSLFLNGLLQQENCDFSAARTSFEQALVSLTPDYFPFIYNALGTNYVLTHDYLHALHYHQRAFEYLQEQKPENFGILQQSAYNCGNDSRALGYHVKARFYFEEATRYIQETTTIVNAGNLYLGLGYCTYALLFQRAGIFLSHQGLEPEEIEHTFQQTREYLTQSCTLYQMSGNKLDEIHASATQVMVLADWIFWKSYKFSPHQLPQSNVANGTERSPLPDDAYQQGKQLLLKLFEQYGQSSDPPTAIYSTAVTALTYLIHIAIRNAMDTRVRGSITRSAQERIRAMILSEYLLAFLSSKRFSWECIQQCIHISINNLPDPTSVSLSSETLEKVKVLLSHDAHLLTDVCFALGTVAEEIALVTDESDNGNERFYLANQLFQQALTSALFEVPGSERDPSYAVRVYQRYMVILEHRVLSTSESKNAFEQLLVAVNNLVMTLPSSLLPLFFEHMPS